MLAIKTWQVDQGFRPSSGQKPLNLALNTHVSDWLIRNSRAGHSEGKLELESAKSTAACNYQEMWLHAGSGRNTCLKRESREGISIWQTAKILVWSFWLCFCTVQGVWILSYIFYSVITQQRNHFTTGSERRWLQSPTYTYSMIEIDLKKVWTCPLKKENQWKEGIWSLWHLTITVFQSRFFDHRD